MPSQTIRVAVLSPYPAVRAGLRSMIDAMEAMASVAELSPEALEAAPPDADVLVADLEGDAGEVLAALEEVLPEVPLVLLAPGPEAYGEAERPIAAGRAYLLRDADAADIEAAIRAVVRGLVVLDPSLAERIPAGAAERVPGVVADSDELTAREREVLGLVALGLPNKAIALRLGVSEHTVKFHVGAILSKLGAAGRTEAVMLAARKGLLAL